MSQKLVFFVSPEARQLAEHLDRRFVLESCKFYPDALQVECPRRDCVGLGYLGFDTAMCFICEHQWPAWGDRSKRSRRAPLAPAPRPREEAAQAEAEAAIIKECPRCLVPIEKEGGCDHMTCVCGYQFSWETLEAWWD